jgi:hypothetical protein
LEPTVHVQVELRADYPECRIGRVVFCDPESNHCERQIAESLRGILVEYILAIELPLEQVSQEVVVDIRIIVTLIGLRCLECSIKIAVRAVNQFDRQAHGVVAFLEDGDILGIGANADRSSSPTLILRCGDTHG